nr:glycosyltransferase family 39 protein [Candidatus Levybacteria bacterium]
MKFIKKYFPFILILVFSYFAFKPVLNSGFFLIHDDTQVARVYEMTKSLKVGMFPVRWVFDLGYGFGYPIFNFYAPLSYYYGSIFNILGFDALSATKIMMVTGIIMAGIFMYLFVKELFGKIAGIVASLFYVYAPYHALDIYVRGDVSEFWAYAFIPLVFYGLWKIYKKKSWLFVIISSLGYAGIITSHNLTAMMITPFLLLYILFLSLALYKKKQKSSITYLLCGVFLGVIVSCFYWFPALSEMKYTNVLSQIGGGSNFSDHFVCVSQLWTSQWAYGGSTLGCVDGLSFMIGKLHILISIFSAVGVSLLFFSKKQNLNKEKILITVVSFMAFIFSVFLTLENSKFIWQAVPLMAFFQFPWRFLLVITFFSSVLTGSFIWLISFLPIKRFFPHFVLEVSVLLILLLLFLNIKFFVPQKFLNVNSSYYTSEYSLKWTTSKISDEYLPKDMRKPKNAKEALLNKQTFSFQETPIEKLANFISLAGVLLLFAGIIRLKPKV